MTGPRAPRRAAARLLLAASVLAPAACGDAADAPPQGTAARGAESAGAAAPAAEVGSLEILEPRLRSAAGDVAAVYLSVVDRGGEGDRLVAVACDAATGAMLHESVLEGERMRMRMIEGGIEIPPAGRAELRPGGVHVMLTGLARPPELGDTVEVRLRFERAGEVAVPVPVVSYEP